MLTEDYGTPKARSSIGRRGASTVPSRRRLLLGQAIRARLIWGNVTRRGLGIVGLLDNDVDRLFVVQFLLTCLSAFLDEAFLAVFEFLLPLR